MRKEGKEGRMNGGGTCCIDTWRKETFSSSEEEGKERRWSENRVWKYLHCDSDRHRVVKKREWGEESENEVVGWVMLKMRMMVTITHRSTTWGLTHSITHFLLMRIWYGAKWMEMWMIPFSSSITAVYFLPISSNWFVFKWRESKVRGKREV